MAGKSTILLGSTDSSFVIVQGAGVDDEKD